MTMSYYLARSVRYVISGTHFISYIYHLPVRRCHHDGEGVVVGVGIVRAPAEFEIVMAGSRATQLRRRGRQRQRHGPNSRRRARSYTVHTSNFDPEIS